MVIGIQLRNVPSCIVVQTQEANKSNQNCDIHHIVWEELRPDGIRIAYVFLSTLFLSQLFSSQLYRQIN